MIKFTSLPFESEAWWLSQSNVNMHIHAYVKAIIESSKKKRLSYYS